MSAATPAAPRNVDGRATPMPVSGESMPQAPVVTVRSLSKRYGEVLAVDDVTFSLEAGTVTGYLGPNGAGKTTTLRLLLGLAEPTAGQALVFGRRYRELEQPTRHVGAVLESGDFHPARSGRDHLRALALAAGLPLSRVEEVLELVELGGAAKRRVRTYSLGMRQRLGLAPRGSATRTSLSSTSRLTGSTRRACAGCAPSCRPLPHRVGRCSSPATCSQRSPRPSTGC